MIYKTLHPDLETEWKFTPGPWYIPDKHLQNAETGDEFPMVCAWDTEAEVSVTVATLSPDADEMFGNLKLIAAAPELFMALESIVNDWMWAGSPPYLGNIRAAQELIFKLKK